MSKYTERFTLFREYEEKHGPLMPYEHNDKEIFRYQCFIRERVKSFTTAYRDTDKVFVGYDGKFPRIVDQDAFTAHIREFVHGE